MALSLTRLWGEKIQENKKCVEDIRAKKKVYEGEITGKRC